VSTQPTRLFNPKDDVIIVHSDLIRSYITEHLPRFTGLNSVKFTIDYPEQFGAVIAEAENTLSDAFIVSTQVNETSQVKESITTVGSLLNKLGYFVKDAFIQSPNTISEFRLGKIAETSQNTDQFIGFTTDVLVTVEKHLTALEAKGLNRELIMDIDTALKNLQLQRREQKEAMKARPHLTHERISKMNNLWKHLVDMRDASEHVFDDKPELKSLFDLPKNRVYGSDEGEISDVSEVDGELDSEDPIVAE
jgi:hypothetical protein